MTTPTDAPPPPDDAGSAAQPRRPLSPAAERALKEAAERRAAAERARGKRPREIDGPEGPEPTRYGDWEKGGIASDF